MLDLNSARWGFDDTETVAAHGGEVLAARKQGTRWCGKQRWRVGIGGGGCGGSLWWLLAWKSYGGADTEELTG